MGNMGKFRRSWSLFTSSCAVVKADRKLLILPVVSGACIIVTAGALLLGIWKIHPLVQTTTSAYGAKQVRSSVTPVTGALAFLGYLLVTFIGMYFNAALISAANDRLDGKTPSIRGAFAGARRHAGPIALWALFSATVSVAIRQASQRLGFVGRIVLSVVGVLWSVATFFVLPIIVIEGVGPKDAFARSKALMRRTWGEQVIGNGMVSVILGPVFVFLFILTAITTAAVGIAALIPALMAFILLLAFDSMVSVVYSTALYRYAQSGVVPAGFSAEAIAGSFTPKKAKRGKSIRFRR